MFRSDRQRKAMFANMFATKPDIKFKLGYEQAVSDEEIDEIINKDVNIAELPKGTMEYFPIKDFGKSNAKKFSDDFSSMLESGKIKSRAVPVYDEGVMVGYSSIASESGRLYDVAPKIADPGFYDEVYFAGEDDDLDAYEENRLKMIDTWSQDEGVNAELYFMYTSDNGSLGYDDFIDKYNFMLGKGNPPPVAVKKVKEYYG